MNANTAKNCLERLTSTIAAEIPIRRIAIHANIGVANSALIKVTGAMMNMIILAAQKKLARSMRQALSKRHSGLCVKTDGI